MTHAPFEGLVLGIAPTTRGFGFALFEGPLAPIDWGVVGVRGDKNVQTIEKVAGLIERYHVDVLVLESTARSRRAKRIKRLMLALDRLARTKQVDVHRYGQPKVKACFERLGASTKREIAQVLAEHVPPLRGRKPPRRRIWMSEDPRMSIFDAAALVFTFFCFDADGG